MGSNNKIEKKITVHNSIIILLNCDRIVYCNFQLSVISQLKRIMLMLVLKT